MGNSQDVMRAQRRKKEMAVELMGGKCQLCGYDKCINSLHFHHIDAKTKEGSPSYLIMRAKWEIAVKELKKCILVCANCHGEIHFKEMDVSLLVHKHPWYVTKCSVCLKKFETQVETQQFCSNLCRAFSDRRTERPTKVELKKLIETTSWVQIGKMFDVSDNAIRKWAKSYGLL